MHIYTLCTLTQTGSVLSLTIENALLRSSPSFPLSNKPPLVPGFQYNTFRIAVWQELNFHGECVYVCMCVILWATYNELPRDRIDTIATVE